MLECRLKVGGSPIGLSLSPNTDIGISFERLGF